MLSTAKRQHIKSHLYTYRWLYIWQPTRNTNSIWSRKTSNRSLRIFLDPLSVTPIYTQNACFICLDSWGLGWSKDVCAHAWDIQWYKCAITHSCGVSAPHLHVTNTSFLLHYKRGLAAQQSHHTHAPTRMDRTNELHIGKVANSQRCGCVAQLLAWHNTPYGSSR